MTILSKVLSTIPDSHTVTYSCTFNNNWSAANHPINYPENAHWSPPVVAAHSFKYNMWESGELATNGVESVAEVGATGTLKGELRIAQDKNKVGEFVTGMATFNRSTQSQTFDDITLTPWFDHLSSITMVAPSPDWFTGFDSFSPIDDDADVWYESFTIATYPWDAGTEQGNNFSISNNSENPHLPIMQLTKDTVPSNGVLLNQDMTDVLPMATWTCTMRANSCEDHPEVAFRGKEDKDCDWADHKKERKRNKRCNKRYEGRRIHDFCPVACRLCASD